MSVYDFVLKNTPFFDYSEDFRIPYNEDYGYLSQTCQIGARNIKNRICYQPMEGQDGADGAPSERTFERYRELSEGGAGIIWFEAVSICKEGMSNPAQLMITEENIGAFSALASVLEGSLHIMQLNHSGAHSKPDGIPAPVGIDDSKYLESLIPMYVKSAKLAIAAGFDGVDIKCCHDYLLSRIYSKGNYEYFLRVAKAVSDAIPKDAIRACRINAYDGYGDNSVNIEYTDKIITKLEGFGYSLFNVTMGSPYINPDVSRPYRAGICKPKLNPLESLSRLLNGCAELRLRHPKSRFVCTGISFLGELSACAASGCVAKGVCDFAGFGRMSIAYPKLASDILSGSFDKSKCCIGCCGCSELKRNLLQSGCIVRNPYYREIYKRWKAQS